MKLQKALIILYSNQVAYKKDSLISGIDCRSLILTTIIYLICVLSLPLIRLDQIIWYALYPILMAPMIGTTYSGIFLKSLCVLPFILLIGMFNPIFDHSIAFKIGNIGISVGWISFLSIITRGLLSMQALLILVSSCGFMKVCQSLRLLGIPKIMTNQLLMLYRYIGVLMEETLKMYNSIVSRGYGRSSFPLKMWTEFVGSIFMNTLERSKRIHRAMLARGYDGDIFIEDSEKINLKDICYAVIWSGIFITLHFVNLSDYLFTIR